MPTHPHPPDMSLHGVTVQLHCLEKYWYKDKTFWRLELDDCTCLG